MTLTIDDVQLEVDEAGIRAALAEAPALAGIDLDMLTPIVTAIVETTTAGAAGKILARQEQAVELAAAAGVVTTAADVLPYLDGVAAGLREGMTIDKQWERARGVDVATTQLRSTVAGLIKQYPQLAPAAPASQGG